MAESLGETLPKEMARVRELMGQYREIGPAGRFALTLMEMTMQAADKAMIEGDTVAMIRVYQELKEFTG